MLGSQQFYGCVPEPKQQQYPVSAKRILKVKSKMHASRAKWGKEMRYSVHTLHIQDFCSFKVTPRRALFWLHAFEAN
jgi:hypothetical protein